MNYSCAKTRRAAYGSEDSEESGEGETLVNMKSLRPRWIIMKDSMQTTTTLERRGIYQTNIMKKQEGRHSIVFTTLSDLDGYRHKFHCNRFRLYGPVCQYLVTTCLTSYRRVLPSVNWELVRRLTVSFVASSQLLNPGHLRLVLATSCCSTRVHVQRVQ